MKRWQYLVFSRMPVGSSLNEFLSNFCNTICYCSKSIIWNANSPVAIAHVFWKLSGLLVIKTSIQEALVLPLK